MKRIAFLLTAAIFSTGVFAAPTTYQIDGAHTLPRFSYNHMGFSTQLSRFDKVSGKIVLDRQQKTGSVEIVIDTTSVNTGYSLFNEHIQGADFLDTAKFPTMTFTSSDLKFEGDRLVAVAGTLTLKGISKPVTLSVTSFHCALHPLLQKDACGANATTVVKRSDFAMSKYVPNVGDDVTVTIPVEAIKE